MHPPEADQPQKKKKNTNSLEKKNEKNRKINSS